MRRSNSVVNSPVTSSAPEQIASDIVRMRDWMLTIISARSASYS